MLQLLLLSSDYKKMSTMTPVTFDLKKILIFIIFTIFTLPVSALDNGYKDKRSRNDKNDQPSMTVEESTGQARQGYTEDVSYTIQESESEEDRASWFIAQSIPQTEKDSKKKEQQEIKVSKKIIKKGKKESRKLRQLSKKTERKSFANN